jgi:hypothetical protein
MKKLVLLVGIALGFVLGSRQGREPYERLESKVRQLAARPEVRQAVGTVSDQASDLVDSAAGAISDKITDISVAAPARTPVDALSTVPVDAMAEAAIDDELAKTFPSSDPPSSLAGPDKEPIAEVDADRGAEKVPVKSNTSRTSGG